MVSLSSLRTEVRRLSKAWIPPGHIIVIQAHACQTAAELQAKARAALGREWREGDMLVLVEMTEDPARRRHHHNDIPL